MSLESIHKALSEMDALPCGKKIGYGLYCGEKEHRCIACGEQAKLIKALRVAVRAIDWVDITYNDTTTHEALAEISSILSETPND